MLLPWGSVYLKTSFIFPFLLGQQMEPDNLANTGKYAGGVGRAEFGGI